MRVRYTPSLTLDPSDQESERIASSAVISLDITADGALQLLRYGYLVKPVCIINRYGITILRNPILYQRIHVFQRKCSYFHKVFQLYQVLVQLCRFVLIV